LPVQQQSRQQLIDSRFLEKLERLTIRWRKSFPGLVGGHNSSRFAGPGQEFLDHRNFHHGDDLRAVNWRAFLRLEKLFLKMFQIEPRVPVRLLLDTSLSMQTGDPSKFEYAKRLAAALAYVGLVRLDTLVIIPFSDTLGESYICSGGRHRFSPAANFLSALEPAGPTGFLQVARQFVNKYSQRGLLLIISDFLTEASYEKPLQYLNEFGHELFLIQLWSPQDRRPPWDGELEIEDSETGRKLELDFDPEARSRYTAHFDQYCELVQRASNRNGGRWVGLETTLPVEEAIFGPISTIQGVR
jgi:uncharacterized protein (DUF58 family)